MQYLEVNKVPILFQGYREAFVRVSADGLDPVTYLSAWLRPRKSASLWVSLLLKTSTILEDPVAFAGREDQIRRPCSPRTTCDPSFFESTRFILQ
jgi:hypothetical protein